MTNEAAVISPELIERLGNLFGEHHSNCCYPDALTFEREAFALAAIEVFNTTRSPVLPAQVYPDSEGGLVREFLGFAEFIRDRPPMEKREVSVRMIQAVAEALRSPVLSDEQRGLVEALRIASRDCSGNEPSLSVLQRAAADLIEALSRSDTQT